jgi:hypothetical protein
MVMVLRRSPDGFTRFCLGKGWFPRILRAWRRTPDIVASLQAGFELFLEFGVESGVIGELNARSWRTPAGAL